MIVNDTDVQALNTDYKPKRHKKSKLVLQIWLVNNNVVPKMLTQEHVALGKIRFCFLEWVWNVCQQMKRFQENTKALWGKTTYLGTGTATFLSEEQARFPSEIYHIIFELNICVNAIGQLQWKMSVNNDLNLDLFLIQTILWLQKM